MPINGMDEHNKIDSKANRNHFSSDVHPFSLLRGHNSEHKAIAFLTLRFLALSSPITLQLCSLEVAVREKPENCRHSLLILCPTLSENL